MRLPGALAMISAFAAGFAGTAAPATSSGPSARTYNLAVDVRSGSATYHYSTGVLVIAYPPSYRMRIAYVGGKRDFAGTYNDLPELMEATGRGLVMNGGFYTDDPSSPAGLLLVGGRVISSLDSQSAMLCVNEGGKLRILRTADVKPRTRDVPDMCSDGLQAYPIVVWNGENDIKSAEITRRPYRRTLIGLRRDGSIVAVFFMLPVSLYVAAEFLRAAPTSDKSVEVTGVAGQSMHASGGVGLTDVVNLSGDDDVFAALNGHVIVGSSYHELPSAIVIK